MKDNVISSFSKEGLAFQETYNMITNESDEYIIWILISLFWRMLSDSKLCIDKSRYFQVSKMHGFLDSGDQNVWNCISSI